MLTSALNILVNGNKGRKPKMSNVQLIRDVYDAFNRGDVPTVLGAMDPDMERREAEGNPYQPSGAPWRGPEEILQNLFGRLGTEWKGMPWKPSITWGPEAPMPRMQRPSDKASTPAAVIASSAGLLE